ncbi:MAG TPA: GtrA family protein, partial [Ktedonobacteraceae bacterium]|nr:GtrA family protein [Ktedonobacteraceae bacterium]
CAFVTFTPIYGTEAVDAPTHRGWGWALDLMRRVPDAPPGAMDLLLVRAVERFRLAGAYRVSLGLVALADTRQEMASVARRPVNFMANHSGLFEQRQSLFDFKQKFHPCWESRYVVAHRTLALPKIALAVLRLRNYFGKGVVGVMAQCLRYCLVGGANTIIDMTILNALLWRFPTHNVQFLVVYNSLAYASGAVSSFFLNKYWTFRREQRPTRREVRRFAISLLLEVIYSCILVWFAGKVLQPLITNVILWGNASKLIAVVVGTIISYSLMRFWTFADSK